MLKGLHGLIDGGTGGNHIFDNHDLGGFLVGIADQHAAFTMILGFFAVVGKAQVAVEMRIERHGGCRTKGNALVGGAEQVVGTISEMLFVGFGIEAGQATEGLAGAKFAGINEIGRLTATFGGEFAKAQSACFYQEVHECVGMVH